MQIQSPDLEPLGVMLDALDDHACVVDQHGIVLATNQAWQDYALMNGAPSNVGPGADYLHACTAADGPDMWEALEVAHGIQEVLAGRPFPGTVSYPSSSPRETKWFTVRVKPLQYASTTLALVTHRDTTDFRQTALRDERLTGWFAQLGLADPLTGLPVFHLMEASLNRDWQEARTSVLSLVLVRLCQANELRARHGTLRVDGAILTMSRIARTALYASPASLPGMMRTPWPCSCQEPMKPAWPHSCADCTAS